jgi:hypothetical protein
MIASPPTPQVELMVRDLQRNLPYTRLFGAHFAGDEDTAPFRRINRLERALDPP